MNKTLTLLSVAVLLAGTLNAQKNISHTPGKAGFQEAKPAPKTLQKKPAVVKANDGDLIWDDDFSGSATWTTGTAGQGTFGVGQLNQMPALMQNWLGVMNSTTASNGFAYFDGTQYFPQGGNGPVEIQDTWIMTPTLDLTGVPAITLTFEQMYRAFNSDETWIEFSTDNGVSWVFSEQINGELPVNGATLQNTISINIPVNNTAQGKLRFRWKCDNDDDNFGSGYGWCVDDVQIKQAYANNLNLYVPYTTVGETALEYTQINSLQAASADNLVFDADVKNIGYNAQEVIMHVTSGAYSGSSAPTTVQPFALGAPNIPVASGMPVPTALGTTNLDFSLSSNNTLSLTDDDSAQMQLTVTPSVIAADDFDGTPESITGEWFYWSGRSGDMEIGNQFTVFADQMLTAIQIGIYPVASGDQADYIGKEIWGVLYEYDQSGNPSYIDETPAKTIEAGDFGQLLVFHFDNPAELIAGTTYLVTAKSYQNNEIPVMMSGLTPVGQTRGFDGSNYYYLNGNDAFPNLADAPVVRMDFTNYASVNNLTPIQDVTSFPNPFDQSATLQFELKSDELITIVITDIAGREVKHFPETLYTSGINTLNLECSVFRSGIYNCTLISASGSRTIRVVKK